MERLRAVEQKLAEWGAQSLRGVVGKKTFMERVREEALRAYQDGPNAPYPPFDTAPVGLQGAYMKSAAKKVRRRVRHEEVQRFRCRLRARDSQRVDGKV